MASLYDEWMQLILVWTSFAGSCLLVTGSIYQAALELSDQDLEQHRIRAVATTINPIAEVSNWW